MEATKAHKKSLSQFTWFQQVLTLSHWNRAPCLNAGKNKPGEHVVPKPLPRGLKTANAGQHALGNMPWGFRGKTQVFFIPCIQLATKTKAQPRDIPIFLGGVSLIGKIVTAVHPLGNLASAPSHHAALSQERQGTRQGAKKDFEASTLLRSVFPKSRIFFFPFSIIHIAFRGCMKAPELPQVVCFATGSY